MVPLDLVKIIKVVVVVFERVKTPFHAATLVLLKFIFITFHLYDFCVVAGCWVLAEGIRFYWGYDHGIFHIVLPEGGTLGNLLVRLPSLLT